MRDGCDSACAGRGCCDQCSRAHPSRGALQTSRGCDWYQPKCGIETGWLPTLRNREVSRMGCCAAAGFRANHGAGLQPRWQPHLHRFAQLAAALLGRGSRTHAAHMEGAAPHTVPSIWHLHTPCQTSAAAVASGSDIPQAAAHHSAAAHQGVTCAPQAWGSTLSSAAAR